MPFLPHSTRTRTVRRPIGRGSLAVSGALLAAVSLTACAGSTDEAATSSPAAQSTAASTCPVTVADPWVKAADSGMSAAFGTLSNPTSTDVHVTAASSPSTSSMELHEVVTKDGQMVMQPVEGGFTVPAGGSLTLEPGGYHLMLMDITTPIEAGDEVSFTLTCGSDGPVTFDAQAKTYDGADETYERGSGSADMDMDMDSTATSS
jgi:periplasmic copper chaperone A